MSHVQSFWQKTLQETYSQAKAIRDEKEQRVSHDCFKLHSKNEDQFSTCMKDIFDEFSKFQLRIEFEQRKVFECLQELKKGGNVKPEVQKMCLNGTQVKLAQHVVELKNRLH